MKEKNNGPKEKTKEQAISAIQNTEKLVINGESIEKSNGNGKTTHEIFKHSFDNAFNRPQGVNSLKYIVESGENPLDLLMRSILPSKRTGAWGLVIAIAAVLAKAEETGNDIIKKEVSFILAMAASMDGKSRDQLVAALTGYINSGAMSNENKNNISSALKRAFQGQ